MASIKNIVFIGAGKVGTHLAEALFDAHIHIAGIYSQNKENAYLLAQKYQSEWGDLASIKTHDTDLIIVSVPDNALKEVLKQIPQTNALIVHTSGSINMNALNMFERTGIFYPLQTFSKDKKVDFSTIPLMIESHHQDDLVLLEELATLITKKVYHINSYQRKKIHIAAVFANNFSNSLFLIAADLLAKENIPFEVIQPLIAETADKLKELHPYDAQTGPALRNDQKTIEEHLNSLNETPEYQEIYKLLSQQITQSRKTK